MRSIQSVVFDLDGTLIDSHRDIARALNEVLEALGHPAHDPEKVKTMIGGGVDTLLRRALGEDDRALLDSARARFRGSYEAHLFDTTTLYAGVFEAIEALRNEGLTLAVATNKPSFFTRPILERLSLDRAGIRAFASADETKKKKPDPSVVKLALERAGASTAPERALYVGDMPVDVETGRAFGCRVIGVGWGFDPQGLRAAHPDAWVDAASAWRSEILGLDAG
jgi:phosphoglycolate phosphatase